MKELGKLLRDAWKQDKIQKNGKLDVESNENKEKVEENDEFFMVKKHISNMDGVGYNEEEYEMKSMRSVSMDLGENGDLLD